MQLRSRKQVIWCVCRWSSVYVPSWRCKPPRLSSNSRDVQAAGYYLKSLWAFNVFIRQLWLNETSLQQSRPECSISNSSLLLCGVWNAYCMFGWWVSLLSGTCPHQLPGAKPHFCLSLLLHASLPRRSSAVTAASSNGSGIMQPVVHTSYFLQHSYNFPAAFARTSHVKLLSLCGLENSTLHQALNKTRFTTGGTAGSSSLSGQHLHHLLIMTADTCEAWFHFRNDGLSDVCLCVFIHSGQMFTSPATEFGLSEE